MKHRIAVGMTTVAVAAGMTFIGVGSASAAAKPSAACKASGTSTTTPGLTNTAANHTTKLTGKLTACTGSGGVKSGAFNGSMKGNGSCLTLAKKGSVVGKGTLTIKWNTNKTSTASVTLKSNGGGLSGSNVVAHFALTGKVTKGQFAGKALSGSFTGHFPLKPGLCTSSPVSKIPFSGTSKVA
jgi:hypothetical protein